MASKLRVNSILPVDGVPTGGGGGIVQVVSTNVDSTSTTTLTTQDTFYEITALTTTITTVSANSKILVTAGIGGEASHEDYYLAFRCGRVVGGSLTYIFKGADASNRVTALSMGVPGYYANDQASTSSYQTYPNMLDSPNQSAGTAITYKVQASIGTDSGNVYLNYAEANDQYSGNTASTIVVMEVSA